MSADWPKWADMNWLRLLEGPGHLKVLPIAPTMRYITYKGERYFRMPRGRAVRVKGMHRKTPYGGSYLWDGWWEQKLAEIRSSASARGESLPADTGDGQHLEVR